MRRPAVPYPPVIRMSVSIDIRSAFHGAKGANTTYHYVHLTREGCSAVAPPEQYASFCWAMLIKRDVDLHDGSLQCVVETARRLWKVASTTNNLNRDR